MVINMNKKKKLFLASCILLVVAIVYTFLVKYIDVSNIAPNGTNVGFSTINAKFTPPKNDRVRLI